MDTFKKLGKMLSFDDSECPSVDRNLQRARNKWGQFYRLLGQDGDGTRITGRFYLVVVQSVMLFGLE